MTKPTKNAAAVALGRRGGAKSSDKKTAAARENGQRGGRPRKDGRRWFYQPATARVAGTEAWGECYEIVNAPDGDLSGPRATFVGFVLTEDDARAIAKPAPPQP